MSDAVMVSLISLCGTVIGSFTGIMASSKLTGYRIEQLEKKVEKVSADTEQIIRLEANDRLLDEKINVANHRIADLEKSLA